MISADYDSIENESEDGEDAERERRRHADEERDRPENARYGSKTGSACATDGALVLVARTPRQRQRDEGEEDAERNSPDRLHEADALAQTRCRDPAEERTEREQRE
jgi:hypothetical protein